MFFLDDDVLPPDDILLQLLGLDVPIACGLYMAKKKKDERTLAAWVINHDSKGQELYTGISPEQAARHVYVDVTGLGCALIKREIFEKVGEPWFHWDPPPAPSEDFFFFLKVAREIGVKPLIDMKMLCKHIGTFVVDCEGGFDTPEL